MTHRSLAANIAGITAFEGRDEHAIVFNVIPLNHDMGLVGGLLSALYSGNPVVLAATETFLRDAINWLRAAHELGAYGFAMPNFLARYITYRVARERPQDPLFSTYRAIFLGAEPIGLQTTANLLAVGQPLGSIRARSSSPTEWRRRRSWSAATASSMRPERRCDSAR